MNRISQTFIRQQHSFAKIFRESEFVKLGDISGRLVRGKVVHRVGKDLYIDFGSKFNAVCKAPIKDSEKYFVGSNVVLRLYDTELSERFLGIKV
ncbi:hypothetical protein M3Y97_00217100 [Aphelenchoides bicaudatus]|nr:hypothetical protein M3Y97_00217100 [Aphelenchoides bicaudatus]